MNSFYFHLADAANWIWKHRNEPQYWEWTVLTKRNPASQEVGTDTLNLNDATAWNIVTVLESKGLVRSIPPFKKDDGTEIKWAFKIDLSDEKAWQRIRRSPTCCNKVKNWFEDALDKFKLFLFGLLSLAVTSLIVYVLQKWADSKFST